MGETPREDGSLVTLPLVLGVVVVVGAIAALAVSSLFVYRAQAARAETGRLQALIQAQSAPSEQESEAFEDVATTGARPDDFAVSQPIEPASSASTGETRVALKPGVRLRAQRPAHWDEVEILDILEGSKIKVRWLSGAPGEDVIASDLVRSQVPPTN